MNRAVPIQRLKLLLVLAFGALAMVFVLASSAQAAVNFNAGKYPATIDGSGKVGIFAFTTNGGKIECQNNFHGSLASESTTLKLAVTYTECKAFGFLSATVNTEGCEWVLHASKETGEDKVEGSVSLECAAGKSIKVSVSNCAAEIKPQSGLAPITLVTDTAPSPDDVTFSADVTTGGKYTVTKDGFACPLNGTGEKTDGQVTTSEPVTLTASGTDFRVGDSHEAQTTEEEETHEEETTHEELTTEEVETHEEETHHESTTLREEVEDAEHALSTAFPSASQFTAGKYPAIVHGSSSSGALKLTTEGGTVECANSYFGEAAAASSTLDLAVSYESCKAFGFLEATVNPEGCGFRLHALEVSGKDEYTGRLALKCEITESIKITAGTCAIELKEQGPLSSVKLIDDTAASPVENVTLKPEVKSLKYTVTKDGFLCPFGGTGPKTSGELTSSPNITLTAQSPSNPSEKIAFRVGEHTDLTDHEAKTHTEQTHTEAAHKHTEETDAEPEFEAGKYPATIDGSGKVGVFAFTTNGGNIECQNSFHGSLAAASTTLKLAVTYTECKAFGFLSATVTTEGCEWVMHADKKVAADEVEGSLSLECPAGKSIKVSVSNCAAEIKPQSGLAPTLLVTDTAPSPDDVTFSADVTTGGKYTVTKDGFACPLNGTGEKSDGQVTTAEPVTLTAVGTDFKVS